MKLRFSTALGLVIISMSWASADDLVITGVTLIDGTGSDPRSATTIVISDGIFTSLGDDQNIDIPANATVIVADGKFAIPGLADMHVHFGSGGLVRDSNVHRLLRQFLYYGVTTVFNLGATNGSLDEILELRRLDKEGSLLSPHIYATGGLITVPGSHPVATIMYLPEDVNPETYDWAKKGVWIVETPEEIEKIVAEAAAAGMDGVKITIESGPSFFGDDHPQMSPALVAAAVSAGAKHDIPVFAHATSIDELRVAIEAKVGGVVHLVIDPEPQTKDLVAAMAEQNIYYVPTQSVHIWPDVWGEPSENFQDPFLRSGVDGRVIESIIDSPLVSDSPPGESDWEFRRATLKALHDAHAAGVKIVVGSDTANPTIFPGYSVHHELMLLVEAGLSPMDALISATRRPAEMLGKAEDFGTIEIGKRADVLLLGENPLDDILNTRSLETVIRAGKVVDRESLLIE